MSKYTRKAIEESFLTLLKQKCLDKITVKEIIELAEINRNTFYYHYEDIYDLLESVFTEEAEAFLNEIQEGSTFYEQYVRAAGILMEHKEAIVHITESKSKDVLQRYLEKTMQHLLGFFVDRAAEGLPLSPKGREYIIRFYTFALAGATLLWVEKQMPDYREDMMKTIADSFTATVGVMITSYIEKHPAECR